MTKQFNHIGFGIAHELSIAVFENTSLDLAFEIQQKVFGCIPSIFNFARTTYEISDNHRK